MSAYNTALEMDWAKPCRFSKGSIWPVVFTFIIVLRLSLPSHSALRYLWGTQHAQLRNMHFWVCQYRGYEALQSIMLFFRNRSKKHDCIVSLSGRRDSSYVLAYVRQWTKILPLCVDRWRQIHATWDYARYWQCGMHSELNICTSDRLLPSDPFLPPCKRSRTGQIRQWSLSYATAARVS